MLEVVIFSLDLCYVTISFPEMLLKGRLHVSLYVWFNLSIPAGIHYNHSILYGLVALCWDSSPHKPIFINSKCKILL